MDKESPLKQIRTFEGDVALAIERQNESLVSIQRAEEAKRGLSGVSVGIPDKPVEERGQLLLLILGTLVLLSVGVGGAWYTYKEYTKQTTVPEIDAPESRLIGINSEVIVDLTRADRESLINLFKNSSLNISYGEIRHIILNKVVGVVENTPVSSSDFFTILSGNAPGYLIRALDPNFMAGVTSINPDEKSFFLIFKILSFENAYAGMLNWEKDMRIDLGPLLATFETLNTLPMESLFTDLTDKNKDMRVILSLDRPVLLYSFFENEILVITDSLETLRTITERLTRERLSR